MWPLFNQSVGLGFGTAVDSRFKAGVHQVAHHALTHHAGPDPTDFCSPGLITGAAISNPSLFEVVYCVLKMRF